MTAPLRHIRRSTPGPTRTTAGLRAVVAALVVGAASLSGVAHAQDADAGDTYAALLKEISDTRTNIARRELMLSQQQGRIEALQAQIDRAPGLEAEYTPVLTRFSAAIENAIDEDIPFLLGERFNRLSAMQELLGNEDARLGEKLARALLVANVETTYGYELSSYDANHPTDGGRRYRACVEDPDSDACALTTSLRDDLEAGRSSIPQMELDLTDGSYIRYGRLSLAYVDLGTDDMLVWNPVDKAWNEPGGAQEATIRRNLRIARSEAAPNVVEAPVVKTN